jgi:hypothetical protein
MNENSDLHPEKRSADKISTFAGRIISLSDEQSWKAFTSIRVSFDRYSHSSDLSDTHREKHCAGTISTLAGSQILINAEQSENALSSIRVSFDPASNVNEKSDAL